MVFSMPTLPFAVIVALMGSITPVLSLDMAFCARINTASSSAHFSTWQSNGLCYDTCQGSAFAIVQDNDCWCSDYEPADSVTTDVGNCDMDCPGYPDDKCGGDGLFGYMALGPRPAGTRGATSSGPTTTARHTTEERTTTRETTTPTRETTERTTNTQPPTTSVETITAGGTTLLQTVTVLPTILSSAAVDSNTDTLGTMPSPQSGGGIPTGAAVGIAVGILGFLAILCGIGIFFWLRRRRHVQEAALERSNSGRGSSAGMIGTPRTEMASIWDEQSGNRRNSRIMPHDPRMDPFAGNLYSQFGNKSRESIGTIQDNHDYSRKVLRTTNPDPEE